MKFNKLAFRDTATVIPKESSSKIFGLLESKMITEGGTGVGLTFSR